MVQRFGEKLRTLRKRHNMTLDELARSLGYTNNSHVSMVENGKRNPTVELVFKVSQLFNVSADVLLNDERELEP